MGASTAAKRTFIFGEFTLDTGRGALLKAGVDIKLRPKAFAVLRFLVERHGQLTSKDELLSEVWRDSVVTEDAVTHCVTEIRRAIGDQSQEMLRTVPRRGYIFDFPVIAQDGPIEVAGNSVRPGRIIGPMAWRWGLALVLVIGIIAIWSAIATRNGAERDVVWATQQLIEVERLAARGEFAAGFALATEVQAILGPDAIADDVWAEITWSRPIESNPTGARVYRHPIDASDGEWEDLGVTPISAVRFVRGKGYRLRVELDGHRTVELLQSALVGSSLHDVAPLNPVQMSPAEVLPDDMVRIPEFTHNGVDYAHYFMDRFEVSNREYAKFVASGGYETPDYWAHEFRKDDKLIPWQSAVSSFVDRTGRPGPSTWSGGAYPEGQGDFPVSGVSWYEANAYARFLGKELPTSIHHIQARRFYRSASWLIAPRSNLLGDGPRAVGENRAMTTVGVYDLVGNVREWCWNESENGFRVMRGGAWTDAAFHVKWEFPKSPWDRDATNGFRLVQTFDDGDKLAKLRDPRGPEFRRDYLKEEPASDTEYEIYRRLYAYDPAPLNAEVVAVDSLEHWRREQVRFDLPYGEVGGALLHIPHNAEPPFQVVVFWGGSNILSRRSQDDEYLRAVGFLVRSGMVVAQPVFKGAYERDDADFKTTARSLRAKSAGTTFRDYRIKWVQELSRTIDYLETRDDFDLDKLGYFGHSWGGQLAPIVLAVEERIDAAVLYVGGLHLQYQFLPEVDPYNFLPRVRSPILMLNGQYDIVFPLETSQIPMFERLGTAPEHKKRVVSPFAHVVPRDIVIRETLDWFDRYLAEAE